MTQYSNTLRRRKMGLALHPTLCYGSYNDKHTNMRATHRPQHNVLQLGAYTLFIITGLIISTLAFTHSINTQISNHDLMLCNSALKSQNPEYLEKCQCFYNSNDIKCLSIN